VTVTAAGRTEIDSSLLARAALLERAATVNWYGPSCKNGTRSAGTGTTPSLPFPSFGTKQRHKSDIPSKSRTSQTKSASAALFSIKGDSIDTIFTLP